MAKNMARYYQAWELRQQGKKLREIGDLMNISGERVRSMIAYVDFRIKSTQKKSIELVKLMQKYKKGVQ